MAGKQDPELKKAFTELQSQMNETNQKLRIADVQVDGLKKQIVHAQLTDAELQELGSDVRVYASVGRMFLLTKVDAVRKELSDKQAASKTKITQLQANKEYLEKSLAESQNNLREMVKLRQQAA